MNSKTIKNTLFLILLQTIYHYLFTNLITLCPKDDLFMT